MITEDSLRAIQKRHDDFVFYGTLSVVFIAGMLFGLAMIAMMIRYGISNIGPI